MAKVNKQADIKILASDVDAVRKLPDVYIGAIGNAGFINMYREIVQNSLDEIIKGNALSKNVVVSFDERNLTVIVEDNGQGIPIDLLEQVFSKLHSSSNYDKKAGSGAYSSGKNGMGATITNFLSSFFIVESHRMDGTAGKVTFNDGKISNKGIQKIKHKGKPGLITSFAPAGMMGNITVTAETLYTLTWNIVNLCVPGTVVTFNWIDIHGRPNTRIIENKSGVLDIFHNICEKEIIKPISISYDNGTMKVSALFSYDISNMDEPKVLGFANMCPTSDGTHIAGCLDAIVKYFSRYMNKTYLANNKKVTVIKSDILTGLRGVVSAFHLFPLFTGQSKEIFSKEDMKPFASDVTSKALDEWGKNNPTDLQKIAKYLKEVAEIRLRSDKEKIKMSDKYTQSAITGLPAKYKKHNSKGEFEFWIVEGDSCASAMENERDKSCQSLLPIRGKISNPFTTPTKKYFENEEVCSIFKICGYNGYQKKFDPEAFKPSKVVLAADADADGSHIQCLLFGLFLRYLPFVIEQGKLYAATPPLYGVNLGKNKMKFFANNLDYVEYVQTLFCKNNVIADVNGKVITKSSMTKLLYDNLDYVKFVTHISKTYAIDPYLLEFILYNMDLSEPKFKKELKKKFKYLEVSKQNGIMVIKGLVGDKIQTVFCTPYMYEDCKELIALINMSGKYYKLNGNPATMLDIMYAFNGFEPKNLTRYKGLITSPVF